jgi:NAD(P)-dependent dehydrogenase (short-subunit alcohol dehydrogenase family)
VAEELAASLSAQGAAAMARTVDATDVYSLEQAAAKIAETLGPANHLVYAAGRGSGKYGFPFWNLSPGDWPDVLRINLLGAVNAAHVFAPAMIAARRGTMLFISSIAGQIGSQTDPPYSAAKAALINFAQCAAKDLAPYDVRVNAICPGMIKTELNRSVWEAWRRTQTSGELPSYEEWAQAKIARVAPLGRWQTPEDVAALAVFLASPLARNITGQTMNVDGGQVMHW